MLVAMDQTCVEPAICHLQISSTTDSTARSLQPSRCLRTRLGLFPFSRCPVDKAFVKILAEQKCAASDKKREFLNLPFQSVLKRRDVMFYTSENENQKSSPRGLTAQSIQSMYGGGLLIVVLPHPGKSNHPRGIPANPITVQLSLQSIKVFVTGQRDSETVDGQTRD